MHGWRIATPGDASRHGIGTARDVLDERTERTRQWIAHTSNLSLRWGHSCARTATILSAAAVPLYTWRNELRPSESK
jgi:hypothetical protein